MRATVAACGTRVAAATALGITYPTLWRWQFTEHAPSSRIVLDAMRERMRSIIHLKKAESRKKS